MLHSLGERNYPGKLPGEISPRIKGLLKTGGRALWKTLTLKWEMHFHFYRSPLPHVQNLTSQVLLSPHSFSAQSAMGTGPYCTESSMLRR